MVAQRVLPSDYSAHPLFSIPPSLPLLLLLAGRLPPQLLASTRVSYVRPVYTSSSAALIIHLMPRQADTSASDTAVFVLIGRPGRRTLPHLSWKPPVSGSLKISHGWKLLLHNQPKSRGKV